MNSDLAEFSSTVIVATRWVRAEDISRRLSDVYATEKKTIRSYLIILSTELILSGVDQSQLEIPVKHLKGHSLNELVNIITLREDNLESGIGLVLVESS